MNGDEVAKLENLAAIFLLKHVVVEVDYAAKRYFLHFLRTKDRMEVDFVLVNDDKIELIIEIKNSAMDVDKSLYTFHKKYNLPAVQLVKNIRQERRVDNSQVLNIKNFLMDLCL